MSHLRKDSSTLTPLNPLRGNETEGSEKKKKKK